MKAFLLVLTSIYLSACGTAATAISEKENVWVNMHGPFGGDTVLYCVSKNQKQSLEPVCYEPEIKRLSKSTKESMESVEPIWKDKPSK